MNDKKLGMDRPIARRDFLNGVAVTAGAAAFGVGSPALADAASQDEKGYYPPARTGLPRQSSGSFENAHALRDGTLKVPAGKVPGDAEHYDLIVVGGGISGLSAAYFFRERKPDAKILILDNHDDFGGHAKRNEYMLNGKLALMNGGTLEIDSPRPYSAVAGGLLKKLGVDPVKLDAAYSKEDFYKSLGLGRGIFFDRETFGADKLIAAPEGQPWGKNFADAPLSPQVMADLAHIYEGKTDYMPGLSSDEKKAKLARMSYRDYLLNVVKADPGVVTRFPGDDPRRVGRRHRRGRRVGGLGVPDAGASTA